MKKINLLLFSLCMILSVNAQDWNVTFHEADELKGNSAYTSYVYDVPEIGSFVCWNNKPYQYRLVNNNGIFNYKAGYNRYSGSYRGLTITVGLYSENDNLIEKIEMWLDAEGDKPTFLETRDAGGMFNPVGQKKKVKKIMKHLMSGNGYVRFIADTYGMHQDFDLKVPCSLKADFVK